MVLIRPLACGAQSGTDYEEAKLSSTQITE